MSTLTADLWPGTLKESVLLKALFAYASGSWLLLQVVSTFVQGLGLPDWVFTGFLWILLTGAPVVALTAYVAARGRSSAGSLPSNLRRLTFGRAALGGSGLLGLWIFVVVGFMASWALGVGPAASLLASGTLKRSDQILISEFDNRTHDPMLAGTVTEALRVDLAQSNVVRVLDADGVGDALERMNVEKGKPLGRNLSRELAIREGLPAILEGEVASLGSATLLTARLVNPRTGATLAEYRDRSKSADDLLDAVDRLSSTMRNKIGEPLTSLRAEPPLAKVTTASMPALRAYTQANAAHAAGHKADAVALLRTALTEDPNFPMAWRKLGVLLADDTPGAAREAYTNAFRLRDNLPVRERELASGSYYKNVVGDLGQAMAAYQRALENHPDDETALNNLANLYVAFRRPEDALRLQLMIVKTKPRFAAYSNLFNSYVRLGRLMEATEVHQIALKRFPDQKRIKFQPIILAVAQGDLGGADRLVAAFLATNADKPELANDLFIARFEWKRGRIDRARQIFRARVEMESSKGNLANAIEAMTSLVAIARVTGHPEDGRSLLAEALSRFPLNKIPEEDRPYLDLAEAYALVSDATTARSFLTSAQTAGFQESTLNYDQKRRTLGLITLTEGSAAQAAAILGQASRFGQCSTCVLYDVALAQESAGQLPEAIATYGRYVKLAPFALGRGEQLGFALAKLAALQAKTGDHRAATVTRQKLELLWNGADDAMLASVKASDRARLPAS